jgi:hypothetical protein
MSTISNDLLSDTLHVIQLARETARLQGKQTRFERLNPVVEDLRTLVSAAQAEAKEQKPASSPAVVMQDDFQALLALAQKGTPGSAKVPAPSSAPLERSQMVLAMNAGGMNALDIARNLGMTQDEVNLVLSLSKK